MAEETFYYRNGLAVLHTVRETAPEWMAYDDRMGAHVAPGHRYPELRHWARARGTPEGSPGPDELGTAYADERTPRDYQLEALRRWEGEGCRGTVVLPTGAGKSLVALLAIRRFERGACVVAPTRALLSQWFNQLAEAFGGEQVGAYYGDEKEVRPLTVTTYHSAFSLLERWGTRFDLLVLDEVHHLADAAVNRGGGGSEAGPGATSSGDPGGYTPRSGAERSGAMRSSAKGWHDALRIAPVRHVLGLTATYPDGRDTELRGLVGPVVYRRRLGEMVDAELAELAVERRFVALTPAERTRYDEAATRYQDYIDARGYRDRFGEPAAAWWPVFMSDTRRSPEARRAFSAFRERDRIVALAEGKLAQARRLLGRFSAEQAILFCGSTEAAEAVSRQFAIPVVRAETPASERRRILELMAAGELRAVASVEVLDEGWDVPGAKLGIVLGGSRGGGRRQHQQRLGRILRRQGDRVASLFELVAADTHEFFASQRRSGALRSARDPQLGLGL